jgi:hypothetical protein
MSDDLRSLAHDLSEAPVRAQRDVVAIVEKGAANIKQGWADNARESSGRHAPMYPRSISYDLGLAAALRGEDEAEIGPDNSKPQGALGNVLEFGSPHSAPHNDGGRALQSEAPKFEQAIAESALNALGWR